MSASTTLERMTADEFIAWAGEHPEKHYELCDGVVVEKTGERVVHGNTKVRMTSRLFAEVERLALPCVVFSGETAIRATDRAVYEPAIVVRCGDQLADDMLYIVDPTIIVEIHSPSTSRVDMMRKFEAYYGIRTVRHYLVVDATARRVIHHARSNFGSFQTTILGEAPITLDPPGLTIANFFPPA